MRRTVELMLPRWPAYKVGFRIATISNPLSLPNFVDVSDPNNLSNSKGNGSVPYSYKIGKYMITNNDYVEFLNAIAQTDTYGVYDSKMDIIPTPTPVPGGPIISPKAQRGGIIRTGVSGSYAYSVKNNMGNKPVIFVSWFSAARYCNWLHNGKPSGIQDVSTTEDGAYALFGSNSGIFLKK